MLQELGQGNGVSGIGAWGERETGGLGDKEIWELGKCRMEGLGNRGIGVLKL